jgi:8-oxo-dGTP pyrophosphatase MutT (NUDIX family)
VVNPAGDQVLLVFHGKFHRWLQPGGHCEPGDADALASAMREVREEVGLAVTGGELFDVDVHLIPARKADPDHRHFDVRYRFVASGDAVAGDDAVDARWWPIREVTLAESDESVMRAVRKLLR